MHSSAILPHLRVQDALVRRLLLVLASVVMLALWMTTAQAAVPHESAKPAYAEEQTILQSEQGLPQPGFGSAASGRQHFDRHFIIPPGFMNEQDVILQRGGNTWRNLRNGPFATVSGTVLLVVPFLIFLFYKAVGPIRMERGETGQHIQRFTNWQRLIHWATAITFITLAITGIITLFGKQIMLPWMGHEVFSWFAVISKYLHNFVGPLFILCSLLMFFTFVRRNFFRRTDWDWMKQASKLSTNKHMPAGFFNPGEKFWFWGGLVLLGLLMSITGLMLNFPYFKSISPNSYGLTRYALQMADYLHIIGATLYIALAMGHIYIGTVGTPGAYNAMRHGTVDAEWARTHHELWYQEVVGGSHYDNVPQGTSPWQHS
ncbi:formate dehydrogenase subunit gamma [Noviherbaspirillum agri]